MKHALCLLACSLAIGCGQGNDRPAASPAGGNGPSAPTENSVFVPQNKQEVPGGGPSPGGVAAPGNTPGSSMGTGAGTGPTGPAALPSK